MKIRFGYVAIALGLDEKLTSSSTVTFSNYRKIHNDEERLNKLKEVTLSNLEALKKILEYNIEKNIHFYRMTSALVPLATHPEVKNWDYKKYFKKEFREIGEIIKKYNMRVDVHPDQFNVINSNRPEVVEATKRNLMHFCEIFQLMNYEDYKLVLHIGGATGGKEKALDRFKDNIKDFDVKIRKKIIIENDDKTYTMKETLELCESLKIPMVLDVHHHNCNNNGERIEEYLERIFNTWTSEKLPPKVHFSSPKDGITDRRHHEYINIEEIRKFINVTKLLGESFDIMIEAKMKDLAMFKVISELKKSEFDIELE